MLIKCPIMMIGHRVCYSCALKYIWCISNSKYFGNVMSSNVASKIEESEILFYIQIYYVFLNMETFEETFV